jgi:hypothetical protein
MEAKPSSSEDLSSFWKDKLPWKPKPSSWMAKPSSSAANPSSSVAKSSSSVAKSSPLPSFRNYTIPPGFHEKEFEEVFGVPFPGKKPQYFLAKHVAPGGLHYCFRTCKPILLSFWVVILRDDKNSDDMDLQFRSYSGDWNVEFDAPRVLATLHNSNITWNSEWNHFHFDDPEMISKLRSKLGLPLIPPKSD